jgi:hypothetical protein
MNATTAAIDLAKNVFQVALADSDFRVLEQHRLTRAQFERFFDNRSVTRVVMEACGSAHHWGRVFGARGIDVMLLPAHYVRAYVRRSKTDAVICVPATRCVETIRPLMANTAAPPPIDADNSAGASPQRRTVARNDWHRVGRFYVGTSYNSRSSLKMPDIRLQALPFAIICESVLNLGGSPYTKVRAQQVQKQCSY